MKINDSKGYNHNAVPKEKLKYFYFYFIPYCVKKDKNDKKPQKIFQISNWHIFTKIELITPNVKSVKSYTLVI